MSRHYYNPDTDETLYLAGGDLMMFRRATPEEREPGALPAWCRHDGEVWIERPQHGETDEDHPDGPVQAVDHASAEDGDERDHRGS